jgi:predicted transcriptional regulator
VSPRTGRPKSNNPKSTQLAVRLDDMILEKLDKVAESNSETRVQTIRRGIEKLYSELDKK